jgi:hypothetical protein
MRFKVDKSTDCIGHDGVQYIVNNVTREVEVPDEVGYVLLRVGAGCVRIDAPPVVEPEGELPMIVPTDEAIFTWRGKIYGPAVDDRIGDAGQVMLFWPKVADLHPKKKPNEINDKHLGGLPIRPRTRIEHPPLVPMGASGAAEWPWASWTSIAIISWVSRRWVSHGAIWCAQAGTAARQARPWGQAECDEPPAMIATIATPAEKFPRGFCGPLHRLYTREAGQGRERLFRFSRDPMRAMSAWASISCLLWQSQNNSGDLKPVGLRGVLDGERSSRAISEDSVSSERPWQANSA